MIAAEKDPAGTGELRVGDDDLLAALEDLLGTRNEMTRAALGFGRATTGAPAGFGLGGGGPEDDDEELLDGSW